MVLKCQSLDCIHNDKEGKCFAKKIAIDGRSAQTTSGTNCSSYIPSYEFQNSEFADDFMEFGKKPADANDITCAAMNCKFNVNQSCIASSVKINSKDSSCETFEI